MGHTVRRRLITLIPLMAMLALNTACGGQDDADGRGADPYHLPSGPIDTLPADADVSSGPQSAEMLQRHGVIVLLHTSAGRDGGVLDANVVDNTLCPASPLADVGRVLALITPPGATGPSATVPLPRGHGGRHHARGGFFPTPGTWRIVVQPRSASAETRWDFTFTKPTAT
jgi:hypothetical protein